MLFTVKIRAKMVLIAVFVYVLQFGFMPSQKVYAITSSPNVDVVFVLDSSGSMKQSDPEEIRTEAIKMFLDMGQVQGNKAGLVAYSDTIIKEHNLDAINSESDKERIEEMASNIPLGQKTDIGRGLLEGAKVLDSGHDKSNRPLIILLSDGKNDSQRSSSESLKDLNSAISTCKSKGYPVYTIGLNYDGTVDKAQLTQIASETKGKNYITNKASDLTDILKDIYGDSANVKVQDQGNIVADGTFQDFKINVPGSNVLEANISMVTDKPLELKLINPSGKEIQIPSSDVVFTKSKKYSVLKIVKPASGQWNLKVKGVSGSNIKISYVFNYKNQGKQSSADKNLEGNKSTLKSSKTIGAAVAAALIIIGLAVFVLMKKRHVQGFGRLEIHIKDENTSEVFSPQFRNLDNYNGSFTLFEVLGLKEEYAETDNIKIIFKEDDSIELVNKSGCVLQKSGRKLEESSKLVLYNRDKVTVFLNKVTKSITLEFHSK